LNGSYWNKFREWIEDKEIFENAIQPKLLYKDRDIFHAEEFKKRCKGCVNALVIGKTNNGKII